VSELEKELIDQKEKYEELDYEYNTCKGEIYHKIKLLEMLNAKYNRDVVKKDTL